MQYSFFVCSEENNSSLSDTMRIGAFANNEKKNFEPELIIPNAPFSKLFIDKLSSSKHSATDSNTENDDDVTQNTKNKSKEDENKNDNNINNKTPSSPVESRTAALTMVSTNDDFIMVDLVNFLCKKMLHVFYFGSYIK